MEKMKIFAHRLKKIRTEVNATQIDIARMAKTSQSNIAKWEHNQLEPSLRDLSLLSIGFGVSVNYFLGLDTPTQKALFEYVYKKIIKDAKRIEKREETKRKAAFDKKQFIFYAEQHTAIKDIQRFINENPKTDLRKIKQLAIYLVRMYELLNDGKSDVLDVQYGKEIEDIFNILPNNDNTDSPETLKNIFEILISDIPVFSEMEKKRTPYISPSQEMIELMQKNIKNSNKNDE